MFEVQYAYRPDGRFRSLGVQGSVREELSIHLENNLQAWHLAMTHYSVPIEFGCTCPAVKHGPQISWAFAKESDGNLSRPISVDYREMAKHIVGSGEHGHVVTITSAFHLRTVELTTVMERES